MLYEFLLPLTQYESGFNIFRYISFRAAGAAITSLLVCFVVGPWILARLRGMQVHQVVRAGTPDTHAGKGKTPTMGGLIILAAVVTSTLLWMQLRSKYVWLALGVTVLMGAIGFLDDYLKLKQKREGKENRGLVERYKLAGQVTIGLALGFYLWQHPINNLPGASTTLPFYKYVLMNFTVAWLYVPFVTFVMTGFSNAVNLTDGLDGLAAGLMAIAMLTMAMFAYVMGRFDASEYLGLIYLRGAGELTVFCSAVFGAAVGFLWYNAHPAEVFMGDTGSLALGGSLGAVAILLKSEFLLVIVGGVFVAETFSVVIQRSAFKWRKRRFGLEFAQKNRVFLRAPIHHHFELKGWPETQVVVRFWIIGILCAFVALSTLKIR
ncbi:phospho-N-acetylmuramoyl-pentapeptide-transferase [Pseudogemmatithrix spongiicola]|uniref:Phospho-N-acetylmuramoyl-pentapeptide-transferase n=1 Tax=Pseudogemmatithrix spongiicola TaxID=3062599 RepID=A0AA49Q8A5_9BACT|nr:phospho-N-acetylmuramoyl-pentapeptide-transferase [Gemmatimonadaceae bacterium 'strain 138']WKW14910.1 phospho-N-acetylmuramoyl-pentapeptide-transferase [Gemmatimonadaceae bacterium 'strain 318']